MKFSVSSGDLQKFLSHVAGVIPTRSTIPVLENVLFELEGDKLSISATDIEIAMTVRRQVKGKENGKIIIPARRLIDTVRALPNMPVSVTSDQAYRVEMTTENGVYKLTGESSENYPGMPAFKSSEEITLESELLRRLIEKTSFAVSTDELRPAMMGILLQVKKGNIRAVATDGHRLVRLMNSAFESKAPDLEVIIPAKALTLVGKSIEDKAATLAVNPTHAVFSFSDITLFSKLINEKYPNYESVIPLDNSKRLVVNKNQLLSSIRRTALYGSTTTHQVRLSLNKNKVTVSAEDVDFGSEARETLECDYAADAMDIGFNSIYLNDVLSHVDSEDAEFMLNTPTRAAIVKPSSQNNGEDLLMLVMPVRLNA